MLKIARDPLYHRHRLPGLASAGSPSGVQKRISKFMDSGE
jgi:hypothetical protein